MGYTIGISCYWLVWCSQAKSEQISQNATLLVHWAATLIQWFLQSAMSFGEQQKAKQTLTAQLVTTVLENVLMECFLNPILTQINGIFFVFFLCSSFKVTSWLRLPIVMGRRKLSPTTDSPFHHHWLRNDKHLWGLLPIEMFHMNPLTH